MKKDTIYIDTDDDITVILSKIKASSEKVVALVPPKRVGVLQSAVNLRLLQRAAKQSKKHLVLVTNDSALKSLAASEKLPVAKTLQSKPEIPEVPTLDIDDGDDIIDGANLPIGDHAHNAGEDMPDNNDEKTPEAEAAAEAVGAAAVAKTSEKDISKAKKGQPKVPNFNKLRKRAVIFGGLGLLLIVFLVWAIKFAPRATVTIEASTIEDSLNLEVSMKPDIEPDLKKAQLPIEKRETSEDVSIDLTATGKKNVGEKATGSVRIKGDSLIMLDGPVSVPAGSKITASGGSEYTTDSAVSLSTSRDVRRGVSVEVTASDRGEKYNGAIGEASMDISGVRSVSFEDATSGGTDKEISVLTKGDVNKATQEVDKKLDDSKKDYLSKQFGDDHVVIEETYNARKDNISPSTPVGDEVKGNVKLSGKITYTLYAAPKSDIGTVLDKYFKDSIKDEPNQRIYDNGLEKSRFMSIDGSGSSWSATLVATAKVGPDIKDDQVKEVAKGKKYDEIRSKLESINGVKKAETKFWPFWVNKAPNNSDRINVVFNVDDKN